MLVKKLVFAPLFLICLAAVFYQINPLLKSSDLIFSLSSDTLIKFILIGVAILLSGIFFIIFAALALDFKLIIPVILISSLIPFLFLSPSLAVVSAVLVLISAVLSFIGLENKMRTYLTFSPTTLFTPSIRQLTGLLIISLSLVYYLSINSEIQKNGFQLPDSLIDTAIKLTPQANENSNFQGFKYDTRLIAQLPQLSQDQIELLKKNPEALKQFGINPKSLDNLTPTPTPKKSSENTSKIPTIQGNLNDLLKKTIKDQFQNLIKPYQGFIPAILALLFFFTLQTFVAILSIFLSPIIWLIFYILEKTKFITFTTEMREVKKMIV